MKADLHLHSIYSDGKFYPKELIRIAQKNKFKVLSLTDHDTVAGNKEFIYEGERIGIEIIPGIELSSSLNGKEIHILGYYIDSDHEDLLRRLSEFKRDREERAYKMLEKLNSMGIQLDINDVKVFAKKDLYGRMHVAQALMSKGFTRSVEESFTRFLGNRRTAYVPKKFFSSEDSVKLIKSAGGVAVIAHPGSPGLSRKEIKDLVSNGIEGIEVIHPNHSSGKEESLRQMCEEMNLVVTGGSDFHGIEKDEFDNFGGTYVTLDEVKQLKRCAWK